jgi:NADPH-dependent 2,4-dienoyl-CoA reductase/sulfur reductase-like enzyme
VSREVQITVDGRPMRVREGATLAAALLDAGITHFRSSVTGEPRAPICGMGVCFECRVTVDGLTHQRSCLIPCTDGMRVGTAAGVAPSDAESVHTIEDSVRAPAREGDVDAIECDVAVVGGGPAGIAAATRAAERGSRVVVIDQGMRPGGQIWRHRHRSTLPRLARVWIERCERSGVRWMSRAAVIGGSPAADEGLLVAESEGSHVVRARSVVIATGARELFLPFPGWTLPGVMGAGGAQALLKGGMTVRGRRVVVAGSGPLLLPVAASLAHGGARVLLMAEQAPLARVASFGASLWSHPSKVAQAARYGGALLGMRARFGTWVTRADGNGRLEQVTLTDGRRAWSMPCDLLCCSYAFVPTLELPRLFGCGVARGRVVVDAMQRTTVSGVWCAGEPTGVAGELAALVEGEIAGLAVAAGESPARDRSLQRARDDWQRFADRIADTFRPRDEVRVLADAATFVCRCEDVRRDALDPAWSVRQAKLYTRITMGPCQGVVCGAAFSSLFGWSAGTVRPPVVEALVGALAGAPAPHPD